MIKKCDKGCKNPYQDARYGVGMRVPSTSNAKNGSVDRCSVCGPQVRLFTVARLHAMLHKKELHG